MTGSTNLGGNPISPGNSVFEDFKAMEPGSVDRVDVLVQGTLQSTGIGFSIVTDTGSAAAAEGVDDVDRLLNFIFTLIQFQVIQGYINWIMTPAQLRTLFGYLNRFDFLDLSGMPANLPVNPGTAAFSVVIPMPVGLAALFPDGAVFQQGTKLLKKGGVTYTYGAMVNPVALANGNANVSGVTVRKLAKYGEGAEGDVGAFWRAIRKGSLPNPAVLEAAVHFGIFDVRPTPTNTETQYDIEQAINGAIHANSPLQLGSMYEAGRAFPGGLFVQQRTTPLSWLRYLQNLTTTGLLPTEPSIRTPSGVALSLYDCIMEPAPPWATTAAAQEVGAGGNVTSAPVAPPSLPAGYQVPAQAAPFLTTRLTPASAQAPGATGTVGQVAAQAQARLAAAKGATGPFTRLFRGR